MAQILAIAICLVVAAAGCTADPRPRNAVLIVLDTLRADRLSAYGHERPTSPRLDALAERGVLFENAVTNAPWTLPAMVAMLSGQYPTAEVYDDGLRDSLVTELQDAGWSTAAFAEGGFVSRYFGLETGFDVFGEHLYERDETTSQIGPKGHEIEQTFAWAVDWLAANREAPFFLLVHTYEPHMPYRRRHFAADLLRGRLSETFDLKAKFGMAVEKTVPDEVELDYIRALYDGGVLAADHHVGQLLDTLEALGLAEDTLVVVTSDHGEDLGHRDPANVAQHGHTLYDELLLVPLIVRDPTRDYPVARVGAQVRTLDILPTILDILGAPSAPRPHGRSLVPLMEGRETEDRVAWARSPPYPFVIPSLLLGLRTGAHKLIVEPAGAPRGARVELYDLARDPEEREDMAASDPDRAQRLHLELREIARDLRSRGVPRYDARADAPAEDVREQLRALGYIEE